MKLKHELIRLPLKYGSPLIKVIEKKQIKKQLKKSTGTDPVFIVSAPRTGSTIFYQVLSNCLNVNYIDNLAYLAYRNLYFGMWLSEKIFKSKPHNTYKSKYGQTIDFSLHGPNEADRIWNKYIPKERHYVGYVNKGEITKEAIEEIRNTVWAITIRFDKPLLLKSISAAVRMQMIHQIFPNSKFIFLKRNPIFTVQSNLIARKKFKGSIENWWSLKPSNFKKIQKLNGVEQTVKQIYSIEKQIVTDRELFPKENFIEINYEDFIEEPKEIIKVIQDRFDIEKRDEYIKPILENKDKKKIDTELYKKVIEEVDKLDWENYTS